MGQSITCDQCGKPETEESPVKPCLTCGMELCASDYGDQTLPSCEDCTLPAPEMPGE